jgi:predicted PurR-regulated permease PerM
VVVQRVFVAAHAPLTWAAAAAIVAVMIDPIVDTLDRRIPRLLAVIIALIVAAAAIWGVIYVAFDELSSGIDRLGESARLAAEELEAREDSIGQLARDAEAARRVDLFVDTLDERVTGGEDVIESTAGTAPTYFLSGILTLFLMSYGPRLARSALEQLDDPERRARIAAIVPVALQRARRAIFLTLGQGLLVGLVVAGAAYLLDMPVPAALGLAAGVMALLPHVGIVLGTLPLILLVLALRSDVAAIATAVLALAAQLGDSFVLRRRIGARSVHIGLLVPWVVVLVGYAVYGVGGAAYGLAFAIFVLALVDEFGKDRVAGIPVPEDEAAGDGGAGTERAGEPSAESKDSDEAGEAQPGLHRLTQRPRPTAGPEAVVPVELAPPPSCPPQGRLLGRAGPSGHHRERRGRLRACRVTTASTSPTTD